MKPSANKTDVEFLAFAGRIVEREQKQKTFGVVRIHMEDGKIIRVVTEKSELPSAATEAANSVGS